MRNIENLKANQENIEELKRKLAFSEEKYQKPLKINKIQRN